MRRFLLLLIVVAVIGLLLTRAEPFAPRAELDTSIDVIGRATPLKVTARDRGTGLAYVAVRLVPATGEPIVLAEERFPRTSFWGSGVHEATLTPTVDAGATRITEGPATLEVWAIDHSWLGRGSGSPRATRRVTVDVTPPSLEVMSAERVMTVGGSEAVVYRVGADATNSGIEVGDEFFPGVPGLFTDATLRAALFAIPDKTPEARPKAVAIDAAGNRRTLSVGAIVKARRFAEKTLTISDDFLNRKVPELLHANGLQDGDTLVAGYLRINRDLRAATEKRVHEICRESAPQQLWQGAFYRLPNAAPLSSFADRRTYLYDGKPIDHQTHLGYDLASLRGSPVPAGNAGRVVFAGPLGIYGNTVILDHGIGLFSLYGHLSQIGVSTGTTVDRGEPVGKTGETGLAGGDHLHFSMMIHGVHVDPVEWWDPHWIKDHIELRLNAFPRATAGTAS
jgi:murein DD-endopeptidase MepM/ murein hydrolase activator NlpD